MVNKKTKKILTTLITTSVFFFAFLSTDAKAYNQGGDGQAKINSWDVNNFNNSADLWNSNLSNYAPSRIENRLTYGDYDGNGKDEAIGFYDYGSANTAVHLFYEEGGKYDVKSIWSSGANNFNANSITNKIVSGDFNGDKRDEVLTLYDYKNGTAALFQFSLNDNREVNFKTVWNASGFVADNVVAMVAGDFDKDGKDEALIFYDYGNNVTAVFELNINSDGTFTSKKVYEATQFAGSQIKNKTVAGDYNGDGKDEVAMFYDYGNATTRILSLVNNNGNYSLTETWFSNSFNATSINNKVVSTKNKSGADQIVALYDYGNNNTGIFNFKMENNSFKSTKVKELSNYEAARVSGRVAVGKFDGQTARLVAMNDGTVVQSKTKAQKVLDEAYKHLGKAYVYGAVGPNTFDCSGFTQYVYKNAVGIQLSRTTYTQINEGRAISYSELQPGDLVFTYGLEHMGIYVGDGKYIHASQPGDVVKVSSITNFHAARRIL